MSESIFEDDVEIIANAEALEEDYTPSELPCLDIEKQQYVDVLKPIYKGRPPQNAFLYGDTGVGKTVLTKFLLRELREDVDRNNETDFDVVRLNCQNLTGRSEKATSYQVAVGLVNELRPPEDMIASTGYAPQAVYSMLYDELDALGGNVLIVLDEVDAIGDDDNILYDLPRARDNDKVSNCRIGLIGISNDYTFRDMLSPKVKDSLCETEIRFSAYDADELKAIVTSRAEIALTDHSWNEPVVALCAALAKQDSTGSARKAIRLLKKSAEIAETRGVEEISEETVHDANEELEYGEIVESILDQDDHKILILNAIGRCEASGRTPVRVKDVHDVYTTVCAESDTLRSEIVQDPLGQRAMYNHLSKLEMMGFLEHTEKNKGRNGGKFHLYGLSDEMSVETIRGAMDDISVPFEFDATGLAKYT